MRKAVAQRNSPCDNAYATGRVAFLTATVPLFWMYKASFAGFTMSCTIRRLSPVLSYSGPPLTKGHKFKLHLQDQ